MPTDQQCWDQVEFLTRRIGKMSVVVEVEVEVEVAFDLDVKSAWALCPYREESLPCKAMSFRRRAAVPHEFPATPLPFVRGRKWIRNETCLSAASSFHFPFFDLHKREREGQRLAAAFLLPTFLWRSKEKRVAAGLPPASHHKVATASISDKHKGIPAKSLRKSVCR
jgi:hypothetical protein